MMRRFWSVLAVLMIVQGGFFAGTRATGQEKTSQDKLLGKAFGFWKITQVVPATKESKVKNPTHLGSIFVVQSNADGETIDRMWLSISTETKFSIGLKSEGARVEDLTKGMTVTFEFSGTTKTLPPTGFATVLGASGK
jgi:hypothetical protein